MRKTITIVDNGRGPQLSTSRITVQDLLPYLQRKCSYDEILNLMPVLTVEEVQAIQHYVQEHYEQVMESDRRIRERNAQRRMSPAMEEVLRRGGEKMSALREQLAKKKAQECNGDHAAR